MYKLLGEAFNNALELKPLVANVNHCEFVIAPVFTSGNSISLVPRPSFLSAERYIIGEIGESGESGEMRRYRRNVTMSADRYIFFGSFPIAWRSWKTFR